MNDKVVGHLESYFRQQSATLPIASRTAIVIDAIEKNTDSKLANLGEEVLSTPTEKNKFPTPHKNFLVCF